MTPLGNVNAHMLLFNLDRLLSGISFDLQSSDRTRQLMRSVNVHRTFDRHSSTSISLVTLGARLTNDLVVERCLESHCTFYRTITFGQNGRNTFSTRSEKLRNDSVHSPFCPEDGHNSSSFRSLDYIILSR